MKNTENEPSLKHDKQRLEAAIEAISTPLFSTRTHATYDTEYFTNVSGIHSAKIQPHYLSLEYMAIPELPYTIPGWLKERESNLFLKEARSLSL